MTPQQIAAKRGWQTLADGAIVVALVAGVLPIVEAIQSADGWSTWVAGWQTWTWTAAQAAVVAGLTALVSWVRRRWITPPDQDPQRAVKD